MQMTSDARAWLDATVRRILARHTLGEPERSGITYELMSHLHAAGEAHATAAGRTEVTLLDLAAALRDSGGEQGLAAAFVQPLARPLERVLFWRRAGAFGIDAIILGIVLTFLHSVIPFLLSPFAGHATMMQYSEDYWGLFPWGYHDTTMPLVIQAIIAAASGALVLGYFTWFEGKEGRSLGKRALDLRVVRLDGEPMGPREAFIRNLVKVSPPFLALDTLIMLLAFREEKQRVSDRIVSTIVVRT